MAEKIQIEVVKKEQVTEKIYFVTFRLIEPQAIEFRAGQNMMLMIAPGINRTMSIASSPSQKDELLMIHDVSPMGPGSKWTVGLKIGERVSIVAPTGGALSFVDSSRKKVMVATGTGIAPFHAMILDKPQLFMELYWGLRYETDIFWKNEFEKLIPFHLVLSKPSETWQGLRGHVTEHVLGNEKDLHDSEFYLCGNKAMVEEVRGKLLERNVPKEQIKSELFY